MAQSSKPPESAVATPVTAEEPTNIAPPVATDSFNSDVLNALNNLNKLTAQSLDALVRTAGHAEKTAGGIDGLNGNRFG
jgi:hypothetical protein